MKFYILIIFLFALSACQQKIQKCAAYEKKTIYTWQTGAQLGEPGIGRNVYKDIYVCANKNLN